jgi:Ca-activated chloride channel family protein
VKKQSEIYHKNSVIKAVAGLIRLAMVLTLLISAATSLQAHPAFNIRSGLAALQSGDLEQAETELQRARFAAPDNPTVFYNLGVVSYRRRDYQKAAGFFMQASSAAGVDEQMKFDSLYNLGNTAFKAGDYAAAVSAYSGSIEVKADEKAKYNLEVARKKLQEQQQEQEQEQEQKQQNEQNKQDKNQPQQDQQKQDQKGQQDKSDQKSGEQNDQQGDQSQKNQNDQNDQKDPQKKPGQDQQNASGKDSESDSEKQKQDEQQKADQQPAEPKSGEESEQQKADQQPSEQQEQNASQTQQLSEKAAADSSENREDVNMASEAQQQEPQKPDASERARALKNIRLNPYQVERLLQQMQERERQAQLHYRNESQRMEEVDPFNMNSQQLHEWFENRGRRQQQTPADEPDW